MVIIIIIYTDPAEYTTTAYETTSHDYTVTVIIRCIICINIYNTPNNCNGDKKKWSKTI